MADAEGETVPDSQPTGTDSRSPVLENLMNAFSTEIMVCKASDESYLNGEPLPVDSQETYISDESVENLSMSIPVISTGKIPSTHIQSLGNEYAVEVGCGNDTQKAHQEVMIPTTLEQPQGENEMNAKRGRFDKPAIISLSAENKAEGASPTQAESDITQMDSSEMPDISCIEYKVPENDALTLTVRKCNGIMDSLEKIEKTISSMFNAIRDERSRLSESSIIEKESEIRKKIADIVAINRKEKEQLMTLKKNGEKVSKESLLAVAKCHRKLVAVVQQQKILSEKIKNFQEHHHPEEENVCKSNQGMECSQSLLGSSTMIYDSGCFSRPTCLPPSILRDPSITYEISKNRASLTRKKMVQFQIPYKGKSTESGAGRTNLRTFPVLASSADTDMPISSKLGQTVLITSGEIRRRDESVLKDTAEAIPNVVPMPIVSSGETAARSGWPLPHRSHSAIFPNTGAPTPMECDNESIGCSSLISGLSSVDVTPARFFRPIQQSETSADKETYRPQTAAVRAPSMQTVPGYQNTNKSPPVLQSTDALLDLCNLIKRGLIMPGNGVIKCTLQGKPYVASLLPTGTIESTGGEVFPSPMMWLKALLRQKHAPSRMRSYKSITCNGKLLFEVCASAQQCTPSAPSEDVNTSMTSASARAIASSLIKVTTPTFVVDLAKIRRQTEGDEDWRPKLQRVRLVQDDELFDLGSAFPDFDWDDFSNTPKNIEAYFF